MLLADSKIIITGAGAGFGKNMALHFAVHHAQVYAIDINEKALNRLKIENSTIQTFVCDITDCDKVEQVINEIFLSNNKTNILINNAGIMKNAPLINMMKRPDSKHNVDLWHQVINLNQHAVFYTTRAFADQMIKAFQDQIAIAIPHNLV